MGTVHGYTGASNSSEIDQIWCLTADLWSYIFFSLFIHWEKQGQPTKMADTMPAGTCWSWSKFSSMHPFIWVRVRTVVVIDFFIPYLGLVGNYLQFNLRVKKRKEIGGIKGIFSWYVWFGSFGPFIEDSFVHLNWVEWGLIFTWRFVFMLFWGLDEQFFFAECT